jgi:hypothetical protein
MQIKFISLLLAMCAGNEALAQNSPDATFNFENETIGKLPKDWAAVTSTWAITNDGTNKALKQTGKNKGEKFNICINNKLKYQNLQIEVRIKPMEGIEDQGGGVVWRYHDAKNYYLARANPLDNNLKVYKVVKGIRREIKSVKLKMKAGEWYTLKVAMIGYTLNCYLNDQKLLSATDTTFPNAGQVGFWSRSDAISLFDDLKIKDLK